MAVYSFTKQYDAEKLISELSNLGINPDSMDFVSSTQFNLNFSNPLSQNVLDQLNIAVSNHTVGAQTQLDYVTSRILAARQFGTHLIAQYGASNVLSGYDMATIQDIMIKTAKVQAALNTGSLYVAIAELNNVPVDGVVITTEKIATFRNKIEDFLGIPRT